MIDENFLLEIQELHLHMEALVKEYDMQDVYTGIWVSGFHTIDDFGEPAIKAMYSLNVESEEELDQILGFVSHAYQQEDSDDIDLNGLLGDLGISMN